MAAKDAYIERKEMAVGRRGELEGREESLSSVIRIEPRRKSPEVKEEALPWAIEGVGGEGRKGGVKGEGKRHGNFSGATSPYRALLIVKIVDEAFLVDLIEENSSTLTEDFNLS